MGNALTLDRWLARRRCMMRTAAGLLALVTLSLLSRGRAEILPDRTIARVTLRNDGLSLGDAPALQARLAGVRHESGKATAAGRWLDAQHGGTAILIATDATYASGGGVHAYLPDGRLLNEELIELGLARAETSGYVLSDWFTRIEAVARRRHRGQWAEIDPPAQR